MSEYMEAEKYSIVAKLRDGSAIVINEVWSYSLNKELKMFEFRTSKSRNAIFVNAEDVLFVGTLPDITGNMTEIEAFKA